MAGKETAASREALILASLIEKPVPRALLGAVLGHDSPVTRLLDAGILEESSQPGWLELTQPEAAAETVSHLTRPEKRELYQKLAGQSVSLRLPESLSADLYRRAENFKKARGLWIRAAERACDRKDYSEAMECLSLALEIWPWNESTADRVRILRELARCAMNAGRNNNAQMAWQSLLEYAEDNGMPALQVEALSQLAGLYGDTVSVRQAFRKASELAEEHLPPEEAARVLLEYVDHLASRVRMEQAREVMKRIEHLAGLANSPALHSEVAGWNGLIAAMAGEHEAANALIDESLRIAIDHQKPEQVALAYRRRANIADYRGDYGLEVQAHAEAIQYCQEVEVEGQLSCLSCLSYACFRTGDWKQALRSSKAVLADPEAHPALKGLAESVQGLIASFRGQRKVAEAKLDSALKRLRHNGLLGIEFFVLMGQAFQDSMCGRSSEATRRYDEIRTLWRESEDLHDVVPALLFAGGHYAREGLEERLADCVDILNAVIRKNPIEEARATLVALRGEQSFMQGDNNGFVQAMESAGSLFAHIGLPLERVWVMSSAACISGKAAMEAECMQLARQLGLRPILSLFEQATPPGAPAGCDLTPRQMEVLQLLAQGLTSKEIGARLFLSPRTVEMHVARLLDRLNCRTRPEAVRIALQNGWVGDD